MVIKKIIKSSFLLLFIFDLCKFSQVLATNKTHNFQQKIDSAKALIEECPTDTCKFKIIITFYWTNRSRYKDQLKEIGIQGYEIIKSSKNLRLRTEGYDLRALIYTDDQVYDSAFPLYYKELDLSKRIGFRDKTKYSLLNLGNLHLLTGNVDSALFYYKVLADFEKDQPFSKSLKEAAFYYIIEIYKQANKLDSVEVYQKKMYAFDKEKYKKTNINALMREAELNDDHDAILEVYVQIGILFLEQEKYGSALLYFNQALERNNFKNPFLEAHVYNLMGNIYLQQGNDSLALQYCLQSIQSLLVVKNKQLLIRNK